MFHPPLKSLGLSISAAALFVAFTPVVYATQFNGQVNAVPNPTAPPLIVAKVNDDTLAALKLRALPDGAKDTGRMEGSKAMTFELMLRRPHVLQSAVATLRGAVQDPTSSWYGKTFTPTEFAQYFGLAVSDLDALTTWLKAEGFTVGNVDNGRMVIGFSGTVAQFEAAFHSELHNYTAADGSPHFAPARALQVPRAFARVIANVKGADNFTPFRANIFGGPVKDFAAGAKDTVQAEEENGTSATVTPSPDGELLHDSSFTAGSYVLGVGGHTTLNVRLGGNNHPATGSLSIVDELTGETVAHISDITACPSYNAGYGRDCSMGYAPKGAGTGYLKAIYSGDENERGITLGDNVISHAGTQVDSAVVTISSATSTFQWYAGDTASTTFASVISYAGAAGANAVTPTGTYSLIETDDSGNVTFLNAANISGCTQSTAIHTMTCSNSATGSTLDTDADAFKYNEIDVSYTGDANYAAALGLIYGYDGNGPGSQSLTSYYIPNPFNGNHIYGVSSTDSGVTGQTITTAAAVDPGYFECASVNDYYGPMQIGTLGVFTSDCTSSFAPSCTTTFTEPAFTIPALVTPGLSFVSATYSGDAYSGADPQCEFAPYTSPEGLGLNVDQQTPTVAMTVPTAAAPTIELLGSLTPFTVSGTLAWIGVGIAPDPTGVTFSSTAAGSFGKVTCTGANSSATFPTSPYTCSATFTPSSSNAVGFYNINMSFAMDTNYGAASSSATNNYVVANDSLTFSASSASEIYGSGYSTTLTAVFTSLGTTPAATGTIALSYTDSVAPPATSTAITTINLSTCTSSVVNGNTLYTCNYPWTLPATTTGATPGTLTLTAVYSGNKISLNATTVYTISKAPTATSISLNPNQVSQASTSSVWTTVTSFAGTGLNPTGALTITQSNGLTITMSYPAAGATTSTGKTGGTLSTTDGVSYTYNCTYSSSADTVTCSFTYALSWNYNPTGINTETVVYTGDNNYTTSSGSAGFGASGATATTTVLNGITPKSITYGSGPTLEFSISATGANGTTTMSGSVFLTGSAPIGALGTLAVNTTNCATFTATAGDLNCAGFSSVIPVTTPAGSYTVTGSYSGNATYVGSTSAGAMLTVTKASPSFGTMSFSPASSEPYGTNQTITISDTLTYPGTGFVPNGAVTYVLNGVTYTASCSGASSPLTCTVAVPAATVAALPAAAYTVTASYAGNTNYNTCTGTSGTFTITKQSVTVAVTSVSPASIVYGSGTTSTVTATLSYTGAGTAPTGATLSLANTAGGSFSGESCSGASPITCTATFTPTVADAVGTYTVSASYAGDTNYSSASSTATNNYSITKATATLAIAGPSCGTASAGVTSCTLTATLAPASSGSTVTFTDVTTGATLGTATTGGTGTASIMVNTAGNGSGQSSTPSAGKNLFSASASATGNTTSASTTSNATAYIQGILFSFIGTHNFSGLLTGSADPYSCCSSGVEGTVDGTAAAAYGVGVYNFTAASQTLPVTLTNSATKAFSLNNECGTTLSAGELCTLVFDYAPPNGDGCTPALPATGMSCTLDGSGYPQGTYESASWSYTLPMGVIAGLGNQGFTTSGVAAASGTLAGKALLQPLSLSVSPLTAGFGSVAQGATANTITLAVTNSNGSAVSYTYTAPSSGHFTVTQNSCSSPLAANSTCDIYLTMVTTTIGSFTDTLMLSPTGGTASTVNISGTVAAASSGITLSSTNHNFGSVTDGTSVGFSFTMTNNTASSATISFSNMAGTGYTTSTNCGTTLAGSASCTYGFTFAPTTPGASADTLTITSSVPLLPGGTGSGPYTDNVTLTGTGIAGGNLTATSVTHNWGNVTVGTNGGNYGVEITNSTSSAVTLSFSGLTGASNGFTLAGSSCPASLAVNGNCELVFSFTPTATGFVTGTYPITSSAPLYSGGVQVSPSQITLKGTGQ